MGTGITFDDSLWPLLVSRFRGAVSDAAFENYLAEGEAYLMRGDLYVNILDMGRLHLPTAAQRQRQLEWLRGKEQLMRERVIGCAFIVTSPLIRLALSAIFHTVPLPTPYVAVQDMPRALHWASQRLEAHGLFEEARRVRGQLAASSASV